LEPAGEEAPKHLEQILVLHWGKRFLVAALEPPVQVRRFVEREHE
jgi:hypothetical protein